MIAVLASIGILAMVGTTLASLLMPFLADSSLAAVSAPVRDERKTGLVELLAIMAIRMVFFAACA